MTFDEKLAQALGETFDKRMEQRLAVTKKHRFSLAYKLWEHKTLKSLRKTSYNSKWTLRRARLIVLSIIVSAALLIGVSSCVVSSIGRYTFVVTPTHYKLLYIESISSDKSCFEEYYSLSDENGWQRLSSLPENAIVNFSLNYERNENRLEFIQRIVHKGFRNFYITENDAIIPISLYEKNDGFFIERDDGNKNNFKNTLCWMYDGYIFEIRGDITKDEAIYLAYSTKIVNLSENM